MFAQLLLAAMLQAAPVTPPAGVHVDEEQAAVAWLVQAAHPLSGADADAVELAPIAERLRGATVLGIGEATHGDHQDQLFKASLIRELVRRGQVRVLALEANRDAAHGFDRYVRFGEGDPVALMRSKSFFKIWRDQEFAGLLLWLRAWNQGGKNVVRIIGIDDQDAGRDTAFALSLVARHDAALAARLRAPLAGLIDATTTGGRKPYEWVAERTPAEIATAKAATRALADALDAHPDWHADADYAESRQAAETAWQNIHIFELDGAGSKPGERPKGYYARRDIFMAANLQAMLQPRETAALWAHNRHVAETVPADAIAQGYTLVGAELKRALGDRYRAVGFTWSTGSILTVAGDPEKNRLNRPEDSVLPLRNDRPREIGGVFARLDPDAAWIDWTTRPHTPLLDRWVTTPYWFGEAGWGVDPAHWQDDALGDTSVSPFDRDFTVLVWFRTIGPSRRLPAAQ
jgi:erythromycin esterase